MTLPPAQFDALFAGLDLAADSCRQNENAEDYRVAAAR